MRNEICIQHFHRSLQIFDIFKDLFDIFWLDIKRVAKPTDMQIANGVRMTKQNTNWDGICLFPGSQIVP